MPNPRPQENRAIDDWLQRSLNERYSATLREPVPESILKLLDDSER